MRASIARWGDSLAVRLPKAAAKSAGLSEGAAVDLTIEDGAILLRRRRYDIKDLVRDMRGAEPPPLLLEDDAATRGEVW